MWAPLQRQQFQGQFTTAGLKPRVSLASTQKVEFGLESEPERGRCVDAPDSHDQRFFRVRRALQTDRQEARRRAELPVPGPHPPRIRRGWQALHTVDLQNEFRCRVRCLQGVPSFLRGQFRSVLVTSLDAMRAVYNTGDHAQKSRTWKVFRLTSRKLLWRKQQRGPTKAELERRVDLFQKQARHGAAGTRRKPKPLGASRTTSRGVCTPRRSVACQAGIMFSGRWTNSETPSTDLPVCRRPSLRYWPHHQFQLDQEKYASNLRSVPRGLAGGLAGDTNEHYKVLLDDEEATLLITEAAEHLSKADLPTVV